ncbi:MAG TPA: DUF2975 domain-containing protein [Ureibacillus sp.]|nr:DUF2975 domain-containing protein [Ureibacillus sp.]
MERGSTLFLKICVILMGLPVLGVCIFMVPDMANFGARLYPDFPLIKFLLFIVMYGAAIAYYFTLYQAFKLLNYIDKNNAFSQISVDALKKIKISAIIISSLYVVGMPLFYLIAEKDDAPGLILIVAVFVFAPLVIAVFAAVLQRLLQEAINIKSENDLTV